ncbi:LLM class flavin-dependent oxidoreductase [Salarchaeum sp. JOR-1]|nr:LLM class flavin-dependent oxidoreductase [Salarchaeum sp. JOR-1]
MFMNGGSPSELAESMADVREYVAEFDTEPPEFAANAFVIQRDTEAEAKDELENIIENATDEQVEAFKEQVKQAGQSTAAGDGMWADSEFEDLVQYNDGFKTGLIGTEAQIVERIRELDAIGIDIVLAGFLNYDWELEQFGETIIPAVEDAEPLPEREPAAVADG